MNINIADVKVLISKEEVANRIKELAEQINKDYEGKSITLLCILKGSVFFTTELAKHLAPNTKIEFIEVSSYGSGTMPGEIKMLKDTRDSIAKKDVLIIEDIIDSGRTLRYLVDMLKNRKPNSLKLCTLLSKPERRKVDIKVDYLGFEVPNKFIVGYGMDIDENFRNLDYIGYIEE